MKNKRIVTPLLSKAGQEIYSPLLERIISGAIQPGTRMPTRRTLMEQFNTTSVTVQRAFDRLAHAGFIEGKGRRGTFVVPRPPHLHRIGLVFRSSPGKAEWRHLWTVVRQAGCCIEREDEWSFQPYFDVRPDHLSDDWHRLCRDVKERHLAGLFFGVRPDCRFEALEKLKIPKVALAEAPLQGLPVITIDQDDFLRKAVAWLLERGCRRIGLITVPGHALHYREMIDTLLHGCNVRTARRWMQLGDQQLPEWSAHLSEMLFHGPAEDRPDGLVISDDNLTRPVCMGMLACGVTPNADVHVVSHANFPNPEESSVSGVHRIGFDNVRMLRDALMCIRKQRAGEAVPDQLFIQACSEGNPPLQTGVVSTSE